MDSHDPVVGNSDAVFVSSQIFYDVLGAGERLPTVDVPLLGVQFSEKRIER